MPGGGGAGASRTWLAGIKARGHFRYRDRHGRVRAETIDFGDTVTVEAIENATTLLQACVDTHIGLVTMESVVQAEDETRGAAGPHATEVNVLELEFLDAAGNTYRAPVIGPVDGAIDAAGNVIETFEPIANLIAYLLVWAVSDYGVALSTFVGGKLRAKPNGADALIGVSENIKRGGFQGRFYHSHGWDVRGGE